ncbi:MAG: hypothetical protein NTX29_09020, partial [Actinobacteria bacterium]|nr:hypothetical protein [Actinomycetota bacterium]
MSNDPPAADMYLRIRGETGVVEHPLTGPGGVVRVAVGQPGHRSSVWRIWSNRASSDVYIAARTIAAHQKFSLHESGDWRYQWVRRDNNGSSQGPDSRIIDRWSPPNEVAHGMVPGVSIWVPHGQLNRLTDDRLTTKEAKWIPEPTIGQAIGIHVVLWTPDLSELA